jgi:protein-disulfide isomerase
MSRSNKSSSLPTILFLAIIIGGGLYIFKDKIMAKGAVYNKEIESSSEVHTSISREEVKTLIQEFIQENPDLVLKSLEDLQTRKMRELEEKAKGVLKDKKQELQDVSRSPHAGNPKGDVTIIEFFDYACGYCKKAYVTIDNLLKTDQGVKVVFKESPILGESSKKAAKAALAVNIINPAQYIKFHEALMQASALDEATIEKIASSLSIDLNKLHKTMESPEVANEIRSVQELAAQIGVRGTPAFVIEEELIPGAVELETLNKTIAAIRAKKKQ